MNYKLHDLGEFRMGASGVGITFIIGSNEHDALSDIIVFCNETEESVENNFTYSTDGRHVIVKGIFDTFVIDLKKEEISLFKTTVRRKQTWSEELAIFGNTTRHINAADGTHYYIQFPFVPFSKFKHTHDEFKSIRRKQLYEITNGKPVA
jgi:hypothetical protein